MTATVLTLDALAVYARKRGRHAQDRMQAQYQAAVQAALTGLNIPGVTVRLRDDVGRSRSHAGPAHFFSCKGLSQPVLETFTLELRVVLRSDVPPQPRWWQRVLHPWRRVPAPRRRTLRIACPVSPEGTGQMWLDGHLLKTF